MLNSSNLDMATSGSQLTRSGPALRRGKAGIRVWANITHLTHHMRQWQPPMKVSICAFDLIIKHHQFLQATSWQGKVFNVSIINLFEITLMVKQFAPDFPPEYWCLMPMCEAEACQPRHQTGCSGGEGAEGECSNDSDADIGDKLYHRFCGCLEVVS